MCFVLDDEFCLNLKLIRPLPVVSVVYHWEVESRRGEKSDYGADDNMSANICIIWATCGGDKYDKHNSASELDTHTNIAVIGSQATVFHTDRTA